MGIWEEERERNRGNIWNNNNRDFPKLTLNTKPQIQEFHRTPDRINVKTTIIITKTQNHPRKQNKTKQKTLKNPTPRHIIFKLWTVKDKEKILKEATGKITLLQMDKDNIISDFSSETMQAKRKGCELFEVLREKLHQPRILCPTKLSFPQSEGEIKTFRQKRRKYIASRLALQKKKVLKEFL